MSRSADEYESRLDAASSAHRHDPLRDAAHEVIMAWEAEDNLEKNDLSERMWAAVGKLASVLVSQKRGDIQDVPEVEVTYDEPQSTLAGSLLHVDPSERPPEGRRSGAKNVSEPRYQNAFISEARRSMGQPGVKDAEALLGRTVTLVFNYEHQDETGLLTRVLGHPAGGRDYVILDEDKGRQFALDTIQEIRT